MIDLDRNRTVLRPKRLAKGARLGIVAPASHFKPEAFEAGRQRLKAMGFEVVVPDTLFERKDYFAGPDDHRADLINAYFEDSTIDAIVCARGGFGSLRVLPLLDYGLIRQNPKIFVGFSDVTALLNALYQKCGLITFHGPVTTSLADPTVGTYAAFLNALCSRDPGLLSTEETCVLKKGVATGPLIGGNLTTLCHLLGTTYFPNLDECILLLEDTNEAPYRIDRMLTQMKLAGCFDRIKGLVLGHFGECAEDSEIHRIIGDIFANYGIPILAGLEIGHGRTNITVPIGVHAEIDTAHHRLAFLESATVG